MIILFLITALLTANFIINWYENNIKNDKEAVILYLFFFVILSLFVFGCKTETKPVTVTPVIEEKLIEYEYTFQKNAAEDGFLYANEKIESKFYISKLGNTANIIMIQNKDTIFNDIFIAGTTTYSCINTDSPIMMVITEPQFIIINKSGKRHLYYETN